MSNQELFQYIKLQLGNNTPWEKIKSDLLGVGWPEEIVEENYAEVLKEQASQMFTSIIKPNTESLTEKPVNQMLPPEEEEKLIEQPEQPEALKEERKALEQSTEPIKSTEPIEFTPPTELAANETSVPTEPSVPSEPSAQTEEYIIDNEENSELQSTNDDNNFEIPVRKSPSEELNEPESQPLEKFQNYNSDVFNSEAVQAKAPVAPISSTPFSKPKKKSSLLWVILAVALLLGLGGAGYFYFLFNQESKNIASQESNEAIPIFYKSLENTFINFGNNKAKEYNIVLNGKFTLTNPIFIENNGEMLAYEYVNINLTDKLDYDITSPGQATGVMALNVAANLNSNNQTVLPKNINLAGDIGISQNNFYFRIRQFNSDSIILALPASEILIRYSPEMYTQIYPLLNQWVVNKNIIDTQPVFSEFDLFTQNLSIFYNTYQANLKLALQPQELGTVNLENDDCYYYEVKFIDKDALKSFIEAGINEIFNSPAANSTIKIQQADFDYSYNDYIWPILQKSKIIVWIKKSDASLKEINISYTDNLMNYGSDAPISDITFNFTITPQKLSSETLLAFPPDPQNVKDYQNYFDTATNIILNNYKTFDDDAVIAKLFSLREKIQNYYQKKNTYIGFTTDSKIAEAIKDINSVKTVPGAYIYINKDKYCLIKEMPNTKNTYWCIDSNGYVGTSNSCTKKTYACK
ncbi:MAG TPA: hypothetical protein PL093_00015 [Candidatus Pacearchaeota archaeon]|nr:hypothetical protein [Candidatus Pacearchaeota archaeon]HQH19948.1 hypothetical protein [Candidatus Pacearchaeota archaeon]